MTKQRRVDLEQRVSNLISSTFPFLSDFSHMDPWLYENPRVSQNSFLSLVSQRGGMPAGVPFLGAELDGRAFTLRSRDNPHQPDSLGP